MSEGNAGKEVRPPEVDPLYGRCKDISSLAKGVYEKRDPQLTGRLKKELGIQIVENDEDDMKVTTDFRDEPFAQQLMLLDNRQVESVYVESTIVPNYPEVIDYLDDTDLFHIVFEFQQSEGASWTDYETISYLIGANGKIVKQRYSDVPSDQGISHSFRIAPAEHELLGTVTGILKDKLEKVVKEEGIV